MNNNDYGLDFQRVPWEAIFVIAPRVGIPATSFPKEVVEAIADQDSL